MTNSLNSVPPTSPNIPQQEKPVTPLPVKAEPPSFLREATYEMINAIGTGALAIYIPEMLLPMIREGITRRIQYRLAFGEELPSQNEMLKKAATSSNGALINDTLKTTGKVGAACGYLSYNASTAEKIAEDFLAFNADLSGDPAATRYRQELIKQQAIAQGKTHGQIYQQLVPPNFIMGMGKMMAMGMVAGPLADQASNKIYNTGKGVVSGLYNIAENLGGKVNALLGYEKKEEQIECPISPKTNVEENNWKDYVPTATLTAAQVAGLILAYQFRPEVFMAGFGTGMMIQVFPAFVKDAQKSFLDLMGSDIDMKDMPMAMTMAQAPSPCSMEIEHTQFNHPKASKTGFLAGKAIKMGAPVALGHLADSLAPKFANGSMAGNAAKYLGSESAIASIAMLSGMDASYVAYRYSNLLIEKGIDLLPEDKKSKGKMALDLARLGIVGVKVGPTLYSVGSQLASYGIKTAANNPYVVGGLATTYVLNYAAATKPDSTVLSVASKVGNVASGLYGAYQVGSIAYQAAGYVGSALATCGSSIFDTVTSHPYAAIGLAGVTALGIAAMKYRPK